MVVSVTVAVTQLLARGENDAECWLSLIRDGFERTLSTLNLHSKCKYKSHLAFHYNSHPQYLTSCVPQTVS